MPADDSQMTVPSVDCSPPLSAAKSLFSSNAGNEENRVVFKDAAAFESKRDRIVKGGAGQLQIISGIGDTQVLAYNPLLTSSSLASSLAIPSPLRGPRVFHLRSPVDMYTHLDGRQTKAFQYLY